jgi:thioredoxin-related protein
MKNNIKKVIGYTMRDESYQDKMKKEIKLSKKIKEIIKKTFNLNIDLEVFYYNIIDVLDDVRKKQEEIVQGLIK